MTVVGNHLSDLVIVFAPAGLEFLIDAELMIQLGNDLIDTPEDQIRVEHVHADGTSEGDVLTGSGNTSNIDTFYAKVSGFSRYSIGGGF